jgi:hypothetical protein
MAIKIKFNPKEFRRVVDNAENLDLFRKHFFIIRYISVAETRY